MGARFPVGILSVTTVLTLAVLAVLASFLWRSFKDLESLRTREFSTQEAVGVIRHLDEVLTMSALQAAATGDAAWEERYLRFEPVLDDAIKEAARMAPEAFGSRAAAQTDAANAKLVVMEHRAFDLVRQGRRDQAMALLSSAEYREQKRVYDDGRQQIAAAIEGRVAAAISVQRRRALVALASVAIGMSVMLAAWAVAVSAFRRYVKAHERAERLQKAIYEISEAAQQTVSLDDLFAHIHSIVGRLMEAKNLYIALYDPLSELLGFPYFVDEEDEPHPPRRLRRGLTEYVLRTGKPLLATPKVFEELCRRGEVESIGAPSVDWLGVPLIVADRPLGALVVQSYTGGVRYGEREKDILTFVSRQVALAIERKRTEGILRASEERYRLVLQRAPVGVFHYDTDLRITDCNERFISILGSRLERAIGLDMSRLDDRRVLPAIRAAVRGEPGEYQGPYRPTTGSAQPFVALRTAPLHGEDGAIIGGVGIVEDTTDHRHLEAQLLQSQKMEAVGRLAGGVAHDFNNVLQSMLSHVQLLQASGPDPGRAASVGAELEQQIKRASALTRQLLMFSRQESARTEHLDLNDVIQQASAMLRPLVRENIAVSLRLAEPGLVLEADRGQLNQVLMNLVVNASDAMSAGGTITLRTGRDGQHVWLEVEDTGHGIPPEVLPRIFEPFFTTKAVGQGTGLGLSVVHGIITARGGRVEARSAVGKGTTMRILFPSAAAGAVPVPPPVDALGDVPRGKGERVLLVEDEQSAREALDDMLTMLGYRVTAAASAEEACLVPVEPAFDLLLTDLMLPGAHGRELAQGLLGRWPKLAVIVMSGYTDDEAIRRGVSDGTVRFLQKPFDMSAVAREIRAALAHPR